MFVCVLSGTHVFKGQSFIGTIESIKSLPMLRAYCKDKYGIEFGEDESLCSWYHKYSLINDNRDIVLSLFIIYQLDTEENKKLYSDLEDYIDTLQDSDR